MANNFRLTGDYYVSKEGSDANSGFTPDLPKLTVAAGIALLTTSNKTLVIGTGIYELGTVSTPVVTNATVIGEVAWRVKSCACMSLNNGSTLMLLAFIVEYNNL